MPVSPALDKLPPDLRAAIDEYLDQKLKELVPVMVQAEMAEDPAWRAAGLSTVAFPLATVADLQRNLQEATVDILDVREEFEYESGPRLAIRSRR